MVRCPRCGDEATEILHPWYLCWSCVITFEYVEEMAAEDVCPVKHTNHLSVINKEREKNGIAIGESIGD